MVGAGFKRESLRNRIAKRLEIARTSAKFRDVIPELNGVFRCLAELGASPEDFGTSESEISALYKSGKIAQAREIFGLLRAKRGVKSIRQETEAFVETLGHQELTPEDVGTTKEQLEDFIKESAFFEVNQVLGTARQLSDDIRYLQKILVNTQIFIQKYKLKPENLEVGSAVIPQLCMKVIADIRQRLITNLSSSEVSDIDDLIKLLEFGRISYRQVGVSVFWLRLIRAIIKLRKRFEPHRLFEGLSRPYFPSPYIFCFEKEFSIVLEAFQEGFSVTTYFQRMASIYLSEV